MRTLIFVAEKDLHDGFAKRHLGRPIPEKLFELCAKAATEVMVGPSTPASPVHSLEVLGLK